MPACTPLGIRNIAIVAGAESVPFRLAETCKAQGIEPFIIGFEGQTDTEAIRDWPHIWTRLGKSGSIIKTLKERGIQDIVLIGALRRPRFWELWPDMRTLRFFLRIGFRALGDDGLLSAIRSELEDEGFRLHGVHAFLPELLAPEGCLTRTQPDAREKSSIALGLKESQRIGALDIGQSVIVQGGRVLGLEDRHGTNALIRRSAVSGESLPAILVKTCKPQQDRDIDLPTIGPATVEHCVRSGIKGIVVEAGASLVTDREKLVELADAHGIFVCGVRLEDYL